MQPGTVSTTRRASPSKWGRKFSTIASKFQASKKRNNWYKNIHRCRDSFIGPRCDYKYVEITIPNNNHKRVMLACVTRGGLAAFFCIGGLLILLKKSKWKIKLKILAQNRWSFQLPVHSLIFKADFYDVIPVIVFLIIHIHKMVIKIFP